MMEDNNISLQEKDYEEIYKRAEAVVETRSYANSKGTSIATHKAVAAQALMDSIDQAREDGVKTLYFTENEIMVLADDN